MNFLKSRLPRIGLLTSPNISPNENAVLFNLGRMTKGQFDLHLLCGHDSNYSNLCNFFTIHTEATFKSDIGDFRYAFNICSKYVKMLNLDILMNVCSPATIGFVTAIFAKKHNVFSIIRMTGDSFGEAQLHQKPWKKFKSWLLHGQLATSAYKNANLILAIGENLKTELVRRNFDSHKIAVLPQPFDRRVFSPLSNKEKTQKKAAIGLDPNKKTILFVGRLSWLKGADRILKIVDLLGKQSNAFQFCLVGKGEYSDYFKKFPQETVHLPGLIPHSEVYRYFQAADILIFPSRTEGLPNTILEALSCGVPVIASPVGDISNWVTNLATEPYEYVQYISNETYITDALPDILEYDRLKEAYINLFRSVIRSRT